MLRSFGRGLRQVTNITRSNQDKSLINFLDINVRIKDKTGVLTYVQFSLVNNHSERRAYIIAVISHKIIDLLSKYKSLGALIAFHCYYVLLPTSTKEVSSITDFLAAKHPPVHSNVRRQRLIKTLPNHTSSLADL